MMAEAERTLGTIDKDPDAERSYGINWGVWIAGIPIAGETIDTSVWTLPAGITKEAESKTSTTTTIKLSGGTAGTSYVLANKITTTPSAEIDERSITIKVLER